MNICAINCCYNRDQNCLDTLTNYHSFWTAKFIFSTLLSHFNVFNVVTTLSAERGVGGGGVGWRVIFVCLYQFCPRLQSSNIVIVLLQVQQQFPFSFQFNSLLLEVTLKRCLIIEILKPITNTPGKKRFGTSLKNCFETIWDLLLELQEQNTEDFNTIRTILPLLGLFDPGSLSINQTERQHGSVSSSSSSIILTTSTEQLEVF